MVLTSYSDQLRRIHDSEQGPAKLDVIFVHGLDGDWKKTWRHAGLPQSDGVGWPGWLGVDLNRAGLPCSIHSFDYPAASSEWRGHTLPMFDRAGRFLEEIDLVLPGGSSLFFICHSLGGLMVKQMLSLARDREGSQGQIPHRTKGILFLGTPHQGSGLANIINKLIPTFASTTVTVQELERANPELRRLLEVFRSQARTHQWKVHQYAEGRDLLGCRIVDEFSAHSWVGDLVVDDEDHLSLPKLADQGRIIYRRAVRMIQEISAPRTGHPEVQDLIVKYLRALNPPPPI